MKNFAFINAPDIKSALNILDKEGGRTYLVAGGTNALVDIRAGKINERLLVNIRDIGDLAGIKCEGDKLIIGAATTLSEIAASLLVQEKAPALFMAANDFADPTTRASATIAGNIVNASPAADTAPPLLAHQAEVVIVSEKSGHRRVAINDFFLGFGKTVLEPNELITAIEIPVNPMSSFYKLGLRNAMAISVITAAVALQKDEQNVITECTIALGSVAPRPVRALNTEEALIGCEIDENIEGIIAEAIVKDISPIDDIRASAEYRLSVAPVIIKRAILQAAGQRREK